MLTLISHLSRLQLLDRIQIVPLDVTLGIFPTYLPWGADPGHRCCLVGGHSAEMEGGLPHHSFIYGPARVCTRTHTHMGVLRPISAEDRQVPVASWADLTYAGTSHKVFILLSGPL